MWKVNISDEGKFSRNVGLVYMSSGYRLQIDIIKPCLCAQTLNLTINQTLDSNRKRLLEAGVENR